MKKIIKQRMCVGCRTVKHKKDLIRIVKDQTGNLKLDISGKQPGRGAYICNNMECLKIAEKKHQLDRSFKTKVDNAIYDELKQYLTETGENLKNKHE